MAGGEAQGRQAGVAGDARGNAQQRAAQRLGVAAARIRAEDGAGWKRAEGIWVPVDRLSEHAIPTVMRKVVRHALASA